MLNHHTVTESRRQKSFLPNRSPSGAEFSISSKLDITFVLPSLLVSPPLPSPKSLEILLADTSSLSIDGDSWVSFLISQFPLTWTYGGFFAFYVSSGLLTCVENLKSLWLTLAMVDGFLTSHRAVELSRLEQKFQASCHLSCQRS